MDACVFVCVFVEGNSDKNACENLNNYLNFPKTELGLNLNNVLVNLEYIRCACMGITENAMNKHLNSTLERRERINNAQSYTHTHQFLSYHTFTSFNWFRAMLLNEL